MLLKFKNGVVKKCGAPVEQKLFSEGAPKGWILSIKVETMCSDEVDEIITPENIAELVFLTSDSSEEISMVGYSIVSSVSIRHDADLGTSIQLMKD